MRIHDALRDRARVRAGRRPAPTAAIIDSASVPGADTVPARSRGYDAGKRVNGRKRHIAVDTGGLLLAAVGTPAGPADRAPGLPPPPPLSPPFSSLAPGWGQPRAAAT